MSREYKCRLCGEAYSYEHSDCDMGAARMERLEEAVLALADILATRFEYEDVNGGYPTRDAILTAVEPLKGG